VWAPRPIIIVATQIPYRAILTVSCPRPGVVSAHQLGPVLWRRAQYLGFTRLHVTMAPYFEAEEGPAYTDPYLVQWAVAGPVHGACSLYGEHG
jgi:hypothetical protein